GRRPARFQARRRGPAGRARRPMPTGRPEALFLEEREMDPRVRVLGRQRARLLGRERLSPSRRPLEGGALLRRRDARHAADGRGSRSAPAKPRIVIVDVVDDPSERSFETDLYFRVSVECRVPRVSVSANRWILHTDLTSLDPGCARLRFSARRAAGASYG